MRAWILASALENGLAVTEQSGQRYNTFRAGDRGGGHRRVTVLSSPPGLGPLGDSGPSGAVTVVLAEVPAPPRLAGRAAREAGARTGAAAAEIAPALPE